MGVADGRARAHFDPNASFAARGDVLPFEAVEVLPASKKPVMA